jgi:hypothetical protein
MYLPRSAPITKAAALASRLGASRTRVKMTDEAVHDVVIGARRSKLVAQALGVIAGGVLAGGTVESTGVLARSPLGKLGAVTGTPIVAFAISGVALVLAIVLVRDSWSRRIVVGAGSLSVRDNLGQYALPYANIHEVKPVPLGGVIVVLRDLDLWLASASGNREIRRRTAEFISETYGGHVCFYAKHLSIGAPAFIALLRDRIGACVERAGQRRAVLPESPVRGDSAE